METKNKGRLSVPFSLSFLETSFLLDPNTKVSYLELSWAKLLSYYNCCCCWFSELIYSTI